jgi:hypothetical protein
MSSQTQPQNVHTALSTMAMAHSLVDQLTDLTERPHGARL